MRVCDFNEKNNLNLLHVTQWLSLIAYSSVGGCYFKLKRRQQPLLIIATATISATREYAEHPRHLSGIDGNLLAGSTRVLGPATGDSFSLLCLWFC